eukprot:gene8172-12632_t
MKKLVLSELKLHSKYYSTKKRLGWIGSGIMGNSMCSHCIKSGNFEKVSVFTRTQSKANSLIELGAEFRNSPKEVAKESDIVISIVGYPKDVSQVLLEKDFGVIHGLKKGGIMIDMTTSKPSLAQEIYKLSKEKGIYSLDSPVSGGDIGAKNGKLTMMVGGDKEIYDSIAPFLKCMGTSHYMGDSGKGQHTKMANQIFIASGMIAVCEGLLYGYKSGLDTEKLIEAVQNGAAGSWSLSNYGPRMLKRDFNPGFMIEHFVKDLEIALEECSKMGIVLPGLNLAKMFYETMKIHGHGKLGTQSLLMV